MIQKVLVLDDDAAMVNLLATVLEAEGFTAQKAHSANEALVCLRKERPDLILLDIMMPEMDGFKFLAMIRSNPDTHAIPVIILTVLSDEKNILEGFKKEADEYVTKPFDPQALVDTVREVLARTHEERVEERARRIEALQEIIAKLEQEG
jgi:two-component system phosphate regulon response regulator PhoB